MPSVVEAAALPAADAADDAVGEACGGDGLSPPLESVPATDRGWSAELLRFRSEGGAADEADKVAAGAEAAEADETPRMGDDEGTCDALEL